MGIGPVETISIIIAIVGCFVGLAGWLSGRDKKLINDASWRGEINGKLDTIVSMNRTLERLDAKMDAQAERLVAVEQSAKQAHKRIDGLEGKNKA